MTGDRERGVLTPADRAYLRGERTYDREQTERNTRARIRNRVFDALLDFEVLTAGLSARDRELVADRLDAAGPRAFDALAATVAFCYEACAATELDFERVVAEGIALALAPERGASVEFDVTYHALSPGELRRKARADERLTLTEIAYADDHPAITPGEFAELVTSGTERGDGEPGPSDGVDDDRVQAKVTDF